MEAQIVRPSRRNVRIKIKTEKAQLGIATTLLLLNFVTIIVMSKKSSAKNASRNKYKQRIKKITLGKRAAIKYSDKRKRS